MWAGKVSAVFMYTTKVMDCLVITSPRSRSGEDQGRRQHQPEAAGRPRLHRARLCRCGTRERSVLRSILCGGLLSDRRPTAMVTLHAWVHDKYAARRPGGIGPVNLSQSWWGVLRSHQFPLADKSAGCA
jgi:hypothetical protein